MPIPREQFDTELDPLDYKIVQILKGAPDKAFNLKEIAESVGISTFDLLAMIGLSLRLNGLQRKGLLESKSFGGQAYYATSRSGSTK